MSRNIKDENRRLLEQQERDKEKCCKADAEIGEIANQANQEIFKAQEVDRRVAQENGQQNKWLALASRYESITRVAIILKYGDPQGWDYSKDGKEVYGG